MDELALLRREIDDIDDALALLLNKRLGIIKRVAEAKRAQGLTVRDSARENEVITRITAGLDADARVYISEAYERIFELSRTVQKPTVE